jgi:hypothetical protein
VVIFSLLGILATGCSEPWTPTPITHQLMVIFDVSGSTAGVVDGYASRAERLINAQVDGTLIMTAVADGATSGSICIPRTTTLQAVGNNPTSRSDSLDAQRAAAAKSGYEQVACGNNASTPGSDLIGALLTADAKLKPGMDTTQIVLFSDGLQTSADLSLTKKILTDPTALKKVIARLDNEDLIPTRIAGADICISDPTVGTPMTAQEAQGVLRFWTAYTRKARATFSTL